MSDLSFPLYQSHEDSPSGMSDSQRKLSRLEIPTNLSKGAVLDIGCNEGFFCNLAADRSARQVIGIDFDKPRLDYARQRYPSEKIEFRFQKWDILPDGAFDLVLWTSAMHYELDPPRIFEQIASRLTANGVFILECGVIESDSIEMRVVQRHSDTLFYPTMAFLRESLSKYFDVKEIGFPEIAVGDPVPRRVFHCFRKSFNVIFMNSSSTRRSWPLVELFKSAGMRQMKLTLLLWSIANGQFQHTPLQKLIKENFSKVSPERMMELIEQDGLTTELNELFLKPLGQSASLVLIDVDISGPWADRLKAQLNKQFAVWDLTQAGMKIA